MLVGLPLRYALGISLVWLALCVLGYYLLSRENRNLSRHSIHFVLLIIFAVLVVRLVPAVVLPTGGEYDIESFRLVGETFLKGEGVYSSSLVSGRHPYFPFQVYLIGGAMWFSQETGLPFVFVVKLFPILADAGVAVLIFKAVQQLGKSTERAFISSLLYAFNPLSILVSAYHGQFDAEPVFLLLLSWYILRFGDTPREYVGLSALVLGFAILNKTWPAIFLPIVLLRLKSTGERVIYGLVASLIPVAFTAFYIMAFQESLLSLSRRPLTHAGVSGWWGVSAVVSVVNELIGKGARLLDWLNDSSRWCVFFGVGVSYWLTRRKTCVYALFIALLTLYVCTSGFGMQWVLWIVPFGLLIEDFRGVDWYVAFTLLYLLPSYYGYHLDSTLAKLISFERMTLIMKICAIPAWSYTVAWDAVHLVEGVFICLR